ncbi:conserved membrane protein of unknown function [Candidatus Promineifilum breve]|uniref:DUF3054 domain-containing protein n=1 Tax=Candidatus Promineifilum breve TaxID=1806508 RepID=A0A160TA81_9CHLR|nr:DUF3054 domain-containing protein [Candidatus Promineifilum breve]CUS06245.1 conserved membrane protein of unknown function [Candidatus Promineifilum breve]
MNIRQPINLRLLLGDLLVLLLFVFIGQRDHDMPIVAALPSLLTTTLALAVPWVVAAGALGALRRPSGHWRPWLGRVLAAWLIAAPLGLILRALLRGQASIILVFMIVLLSLGGATMVAWRAGVWWWWGRGERVQGSRGAGEQGSGSS